MIRLILLYEKVNLSYSGFAQLSHLVVTLPSDVPRKITELYQFEQVGLKGR